MMTVKVRNWSRLRREVDRQREAAASETTPRMPAQATIVTPGQAGFGSRSRIRADSRGMYGPGTPTRTG